MKKRPFTLSLLVLCIIVSCNRDELTPAAIPVNAKEQISRYLSGAIKASTPKTARSIDSLRAHLDLNKIRSGKHLGRTVYFVETLPTAAVKERNKISEVIFYSQHDAVVSGAIVQLGSEATNESALRNKFPDAVAGSSFFSGTVYYHHLSGKPLAVLSYENGKIIREKQVVGKRMGPVANRTAQSGSSGQCTGWFLEEYDPSTGDLVSSELLWIECDNDKDAEGGGGGGASSGDSEAQSILAQLMNSQPVSEALSVSEGYIDPLRKERNPDWRCHKGLTWAIISYEKGIVKYDPADGGWTWESLTHGSMAVVGMTLGGTVTPQVQSATASFVPGTPNVKYAAMSLKYTLSYAVALVGNVFPVTVPYSSNSPFWSAGS
ncbi:MAG: hypothetical protein INR73_18115 [Williamsia sp.]|nr:hypothetical protein [Williamsia sp.]